MTYIDSLDVACRVCDATYTAGEPHNCPGYSYYSELSQRALQRARRRVMAEPEPVYDEERWSLGFVFVFALVASLFVWMLGTMAVIAWSA